ncbi:hypothetical protein EVG20_g2269 [Dentipellis fragilis]|uniref:Band 7 domain-containing protein n=1 Tax=Dentipellis fragilis TaxID=205917 RepID=A0A4Y9ZA60_9AGAM|nr:hypothetical protein EVG20_g2269 [Dentipellis fragilis]
MIPTSEYGDGTTVVEGPSSRLYSSSAGRPAFDTGKPLTSDDSKSNPKMAIGEMTRAVDYLSENRPFFVRIGKEGLLSALNKLDQQLHQSGRGKILSSKTPTDWIGRQVSPGCLGLINHGGLPKILTRPGRYPGFPLRNWWAREWCGIRGLSDTVLEFQGLTVVQVSQNQAAVVSDPQNRIFVIKNAGFVAYGIEGTYNVLAIVDQTHLPQTVTDRVTGATLGSVFDVKMASAVGKRSQEYVAAMFLNIPANNCAILQRGDDLELLPAGQHYLTEPNVTLRGLYTLGENQLEMPTKDIFTRDQVPVSLTIYMKWQLLEPLKLATHGYTTPYDALRDKAQSILTQIVAHLDYSSMVKQRSFGPESEDDTDPASPFLDALRTHAMDDLHVAALEYGIVLKDLAVIDRQFKGDIATTMDKLTTRALQAQVEAANVDRENSNKVKQEEGALSVARIKAQALNTKADAEAYSIVAAAKASAERTKIEAEAEAAATRVRAEAEAEAVRVKARADAEVLDSFAREMQFRRTEVQRVGAYGDKTVFVPLEGPAGGLAGSMATGMAAGLGAQKARS